MRPFQDLTGSDTRLWQLIAERTQPGANTQAIDQRIWDLFGETWAVMFTDLSGFSRQAADFGVTHFLQIIYEQQLLLGPEIKAHDGILVKVEADSLLVIFRRAGNAVRCAIRMQDACRQANQRRLPEEQILLCVGIGYGPILRIGDQDVFGQEINAASKLGEDTAKANEILLTQAAVDAAVADGLDLSLSPIAATIPGTPQCFRLHDET